MIETPELENLLDQAMSRYAKREKAAAKEGHGAELLAAQREWFRVTQRQLLVFFGVLHSESS